MSWSAIWSLILNFVKQLSVAGDWKVSKEGKAIGPVTAVTVSDTDIALTFTDGTATVKLEAKPGTVDHAAVYLNGELQDSARLVVAIKSQPPFKPVIVVLIFKHVAIDGGIFDFRFDNPK